MSNEQKQAKAEPLTLPPLPEPHWPRGYFGSVPPGGYTADQMHAYARAIERAAAAIGKEMKDA